MVFDAEKSGNYKFVMDASVEQGVSSPQFHLSPVYICVNGGNEIEISNNKQNNFSITADASYQGSWESSRITLAENIALTEGENTINIRVAARQAGDMVVGTFDCIKLVRVKNIERITAQAGTGLIKRGESVSVIMKNQDGETVTASDFSQITYTSTNADIAQVDNGILKAKNYGNTKIKIDAVTNGQTLQSEFDVNVVSEKGIWINSLEKTSTGIKVNIYKTLIAILTAVTIVLGMMMMGSLLISSLIIFPALTSMRLCRSFRSVVICSGFVSVICFIIGLFISLAVDTAPGASVVIVNVVVFALFSLISKIKNR
jgi:hypothetical protein